MDGTPNHGSMACVPQESNVPAKPKLPKECDVDTVRPHHPIFEVLWQSLLASYNNILLKPP